MKKHNGNDTKTSTELLNKIDNAITALDETILKCDEISNPTVDKEWEKRLMMIERRKKKTAAIRWVFFTATAIFLLSIYFLLIKYIAIPLHEELANTINNGRRWDAWMLMNYVVLFVSGYFILKFIVSPFNDTPIVILIKKVLSNIIIGIFQIAAYIIIAACIGTGLYVWMIFYDSGPGANLSVLLERENTTLLTVYQENPMGLLLGWIPGLIAYFMANLFAVALLTLPFVRIRFRS